MTLTTTTLTLTSMQRKVVMLLTNSLKKMRKESNGKEKKITVILVLDSKKALILLLLNLKSDQHKTIPSEVVHLMTRDMRASNPTNSLTMVEEKAPKIFSFFLTPVRLLLMALATKFTTTQETQVTTGREMDSMKASHPTTNIVEEAIMEEEAFLVQKTSSNHRSLQIQTTMTSTEDRVQTILRKSKQGLARNKALRNMALQGKAVLLDWGPSSLAPEDHTEVHQEGIIGSIVASSVGGTGDRPYNLDSEFHMIVIALVVAKHQKYMYDNSYVTKTELKI